MSSLPKDNFGNWSKFLFGGFLFAIGSSKLYVFATTGQIFFRHFRSFPFDLDGSNAAAMYGLYVIVGVLMLASGAKGLVSK
jgi:Mn2+/Fe2+ NRAMP family transporter